MENNGGEQDPIGMQGERNDYEDWVYECLKMWSNEGEQRLIGNGGEMAAPQGETDGPHVADGEQAPPTGNQEEIAGPQGETDGPDVTDGDDVQPGEDDQVPVEAGSGSTIGNTGSHTYDRH